MERPSKRARLLDGGSDSGTGSDDEQFQVNEDYAKRHQYNAARAERHRLEEKYQDGAGAESESDSDSQSEDEGDLATEKLDEEISNTLNALRSKDPRIYDKTYKFYNPDEEETTTGKKEKAKPVTLRDYHRRNLLNGDEEAEELPAPSYSEQQDANKKELLKQMHVDSGGVSEAGSDDDGLLVRKPGQKEPKSEKPSKKAADIDPTEADKDPEGYLTKLMTSRAWVTTENSRFQPFESDEEDEDDEADDFEAAYNMRFEDPARANEKLTSHSRQAAEQYSVRRDEPKGRKRARQDERARKEEAKAEREREKAQLRRLKIDEAHEKWLQLQEAAGLRKQTLPDDKLVEFLERGFEAGNWDRQMERLLGDAYYDQREDEALNADMEGMRGSGDEVRDNSKTGKKLKKPKWDDDIDIADIVPDFDEEEERQAKNFTLSDDEDGAVDEEEVTFPGRSKIAAATHTNGSVRDGPKPSKKESRLAKQKITDLVDSKLTANDLPMSKHSGFRYREGSPTTFGLTAKDILMADDSQLNQYAGLKKLASYRDQQRKERDTRKLGKKARLRKWRRETFGKDKAEEETSAPSLKEDREFEAWFNRSRGLDEQDAANGKKRKRSGDVDAERIEGSAEATKKRKKKSRKSKSAGAGGVALS